jgi:hypothetical protein
LPGLHRELWVHAAENFFTAFRVHGRQVAHQFVSRSPFRILAPADTDRKKRRDNPNGDICRCHKRNKEAKRVKDNPTSAVVQRDYRDRLKMKIQTRYSIGGFRVPDRLRMTLLAYIAVDASLCEAQR